LIIVIIFDEVPHYAVFSNLLLFHPPSVQIVFSARCYQTLSVCGLSLVPETKFHTHIRLRKRPYYDTIFKHINLKVTSNLKYTCVRFRSLRFCVYEPHSSCEIGGMRDGLVGYGLDSRGLFPLCYHAQACTGINLLPTGYRGLYPQRSGRTSI
jgi:hypothetical protein